MRPITDADALQACGRYIRGRGTFPMDAFPTHPKAMVAGKIHELQHAGLVDPYMRPTAAGWKRLKELA